MNERLQKAYDQLPTEIKETAEKLLKTCGKEPAKNYLKQHILRLNPGCRFAKPLPKLKASGKGSSKVVSVVQGEKESFCIAGKIVPGMRTPEGDELVSRIQLCNVMGWHRKRLAAIPAGSPKAEKLIAAGYSFEEFKRSVSGKTSIYIPLADAHIAIAVLSKDTRRAA
jgi:hypothetical protein